MKKNGAAGFFIDPGSGGEARGLLRASPWACSWGACGARALNWTFPFVFYFVPHSGCFSAALFLDFNGSRCGFGLG